MKSFKKIKVVLALVVLIVTGVAAVQQPVNNNFKNLQVLPKNISNDSLNRIMDGFMTSLGVDCGYCHFYDKRGDSLILESDNKAEKEITRNMMRMTMDINKKYFQFNETITAEQVQAVTCYTCHRGKPRPPVKE